MGADPEALTNRVRATVDECMSIEIDWSNHSLVEGGTESRATTTSAGQVVGREAADPQPTRTGLALDAPMVEGAVGDSDEFYADLQALEDAQSEMKVRGADISSLTSTFFTEFSALNFGGD